MVGSSYLNQCALVRDYPWGFYSEHPQVPSALPAFEMRTWPKSGIKELPLPKIPFGLSIPASVLTPERFKELAGLGELRWLALTDKLSNSGLRGLSELHQLRTLELKLVTLTDEDLRELADLQHLETLYFRIRDRKHVTDKGLKELASLKQLQTLSLFTIQVTDAGLKELVDLKQVASAGPQRHQCDGRRHEGVSWVSTTANPRTRWNESDG